MDRAAYLVRLAESFARCEITVQELAAAARAYLGLPVRRRTALPWFGLGSICPPRSIRITKRHLDRALTRTRRKEITERELVDWATMILINEAFYWTGKNADLIGEWISGLSLDLS